MQRRHKELLRLVVGELRRLLAGDAETARRGDLDRELERLGVAPDGTITLIDALPTAGPVERRAHAVAQAALAPLPLPERLAARAALVERSAYSWINRLLALRAMEARGLIDETLRANPAYGGVSEALFVLRQQEPARAGGPDGGWRAVVEDACAAQANALPGLFDPRDPATALRPSDAALWRCVDLVGSAPPGYTLEKADAAFADPDAIGWAYQFYQDAAKARVYAKIGAGGKIGTRAEIAAATELFTEPYMVQWLLQNSLGHSYHEAYPDSSLPATWPYYVATAVSRSAATVPLEALTVMDPCAGSGHFLRAAFDMLAAMYREQMPELSATDIADRVLGQQLFGVDIDPRAAQLAALTLYLRAWELVRDERRARREPGPGSYRPPAMNVATTPSGLDAGALGRHLRRHPEDEVLRPLLAGVFAALERADVLGSLLRPGAQLDGAIRQLRSTAQMALDDDPDRLTMRRRIAELARQDPAGLRRMLLERIAASFTAEAHGADVGAELFGREAEQGVRLVQMLDRQYAVVATNPPYVGRRHIGNELKSHLRRAYPAAPSDLGAAFVMRALELCRPAGRVAMVTQQSWMFLRDFADLRALPEEKVVAARRKEEFAGVLREATIEALAHLGPSGFGEISGEVVQSVLFVLANEQPDADHRITAFRLIGPKSPEEKDALLLLAVAGNAPAVRFQPVQARFLAIPQSPLCYWLRERFFELLMGRVLGHVAEVKQGLATADDKRFVRFVWEVPAEAWRAEPDGRRWSPFEKGGGYCRWFGHHWWAVDWEHGGARISGTPGPRVQNEQYYFRPGWTYSRIARGSLGVRDADGSGPFSNHSSGIFPANPGIAVILNSPLASAIVRSINPKIDLTESYVGRIPFPSGVPDDLCRLEAACIELKKHLVAADATERSFVPASVDEDELLRTAALLHALEGLSHPLALDLYRLSDEDLRTVLDETGIPAGWFPLVPGYDRCDNLLPRLASDVAADLRGALAVHSRQSDRAPERLKVELRALYAAGPGARETEAEDEAAEGDEDQEAEAPLGAHIPIPTETFLEELSVKLRVHPISVYRLLEEIRREGARCRSEELRALEERLAVLLLRLIGHRWPTEVQAGEPVPMWADADGIIPLTPGAGEPTAADRLRARLRDEAGELGAQRVEALLAELGGGTLEEWTRRRFFAWQLRRLRARPIAWHLTSAPPAGSGRRAMRRPPVFECLLYFQRSGADALARVRTRYVEPLLLVERRQADEARRAGDETAAATATERAHELEQFAARLRQVEEEAFACPELDAAVAAERLDRWASDGYTAPSSQDELHRRERAFTVDVNDGVRVNIAPLQLAGLLAADVLKPPDARRALADRVGWRADERRWVREGRLPRCGWMPEAVPESSRWTELAPERAAERERLEQKRRAIGSSAG